VTITTRLIRGFGPQQLDAWELKICVRNGDSDWIEKQRLIVGEKSRFTHNPVLSVNA
jgi:hypothetical protein